MNSGWNSPNRCVSCRYGPAPGGLDGGGVQGGLIRFYHEIAGVGLVFPRADRPIAVEFPGYPVVRLRPIAGLEFVEETVTALGSSTELAHHLFRECWAKGTGSNLDLPGIRLGGGGAQVQGRDGSRPGGDRWAIPERSINMKLHPPDCSDVNKWHGDKASWRSGSPSCRFPSRVWSAS
jgi:hypothetical protein